MLITNYPQRYFKSNINLEALKTGQRAQSLETSFVENNQ